MLNLKNPQSRWLHFSAIIAPDYASKKLRDQADALDKRRAGLVKSQAAIDGTIQDLQDNAFEEDSILGSSSMVAEEATDLLKVELALRKDLANFLPAVREEAKKHADKAKSELKAAEDKALAALDTAGFDTTDPYVRSMIVRNQHVKAARLKAAGIASRSTDHQASSANEAAIDWIRGKLNEIASKTLRSAGM